MKWHINCKLFMGQPMKLSTTGLAFIKSVHDGSQSNSQNCTKRNVWTSANGFWIAMVLKVTISWNESLREMKHGSTIMNQRVNARVWCGNILIGLPKKRSFFGGSQRLLLEHYEERGSTMNSAHYSEMLCDKLKPVI